MDAETHDSPGPTRPGRLPGDPGRSSAAAARPVRSRRPRPPGRWSPGRRSPRTRSSPAPVATPGTARSASAAISWSATMEPTASGIPAMPRPAADHVARPGHLARRHPLDPRPGKPDLRRLVGRRRVRRQARRHLCHVRRGKERHRPSLDLRRRTQMDRPRLRWTSARPTARRSAPGLTALPPPGSRTEPGTSFTSAAIRVFGWRRRKIGKSGPTSRTTRSSRWDPSRTTRPPWPSTRSSSATVFITRSTTPTPSGPGKTGRPAWPALAT